MYTSELSYFHMKVSMMVIRQSMANYKIFSCLFFTFTITLAQYGLHTYQYIQYNLRSKFDFNNVPKRLIHKHIHKDTNHEMF